MDRIKLVTNTTNISDADYYKLHERLVQDVVNFFKVRGVPPQAFKLDFSVDDIESSVNHGRWHAGSDSYMNIVTTDNEVLVCSM